MEKVGNKKRRIISQCMVMGGFFFILLLLHLTIQTGWGDDAAFAQDTRTLGQYLPERYNEWTSRLIVEAGIMLLLAAPDWVWRLLNILMVLLLGASVAFIMSAPGNARRYVVETQKWFPEYANLNLIEKFLMGFIDTMNYYFSAGGEQVNYVMAPLTGILLVGILQKRGEKGFWLKLFPAFLPFAFYWGIGLFGNWWLLNKGFVRGGHIVGLFGMNRCLPVGAGVFDFLGWIPYSWGMVFLQAGVYLILLVCVALTIFFLHGGSMETLLELTVLGIGLMSRFGMGFSPTVYASGARTALYSSMAVLIVCLRNLQIYCDSALKRTQ